MPKIALKYVQCVQQLVLWVLSFETFKNLNVSQCYLLSACVVYLLICVVGSLRGISPGISLSSPYFRRHCARERWALTSSRVGVEMT